MRRLFGVVAVAIVVMLPVYLSAQAAKPVAKAAATKAMTASGTVSTVSAESLTIKAKSGDVTFTVDSKVKITGAGAGTKTAELKAAKKTPAITDYIKTGDMVSVTYHEADGAKQASAVRIMSAMK